MFGKLTDQEIEEILAKEVYGHLGCHNSEMVYVVPLSYAYEDRYIYGHSREGMKIQLMKQNPKVCFQVTQMENMANWKSVIIWGEYEELKSDEERRAGLQTLLKRHAPHIPSKTLQLTDEWPFTPIHTASVHGIIFRIRIMQQTGRYEKS